MIHPQEIEVYFVLPGVRREIANNLVAKGWSQRQVAQKLAVTEAAVSQYVNDKRAVNREVVFSPEFRKLVKEVTEKIAEGETTPYLAIQVLMKEFRKSGALCEAHKLIDKGCLPERCDVCL